MAPARPNGAAKPSAGRKSGPGAVPTAIVLLGGAMALLVPPLASLAVLGLVPSVLAKIVEKPDQAGLARCVAALNLAGVFLVASHFAAGGMTAPNLFRILGQPGLWAAMYGAAAIGWGLYLTVTTLAVAVSRHKLDRQQRVLSERQAELLNEWGQAAAEKD